MKTIKFLLASLVLSAIFISCQKDVVEPEQSDMSTLKETSATGINNTSGVTITVRYTVTINLDEARTFCGHYQVEMLNGQGAFIAPPQRYMPGRDVYYFTEKTRLPGAIRIARFVQSPVPDMNCSLLLFTKPDIQLLQFADGQSYPFSLYPSTRLPK